MTSINKNLTNIKNVDEFNKEIKNLKYQVKQLFITHSRLDIKILITGFVERDSKLIQEFVNDIDNLVNIKDDPTATFRTISQSKIIMLRKKWDDRI